jgi:lipopolysaccharide export system permease protein
MDNGNSLEIILKDGEMHERDDKVQGNYQVRTFRNFVLHIRNLGNNIDFIDTGYRSDREMTGKGLIASIRDKQKELATKTKQVADFERRINVVKLSTDSPGNHTEFKRLSQMQLVEKDRMTELHEDINSMLVEYNKKYAIAFAIVIFVLIGIPLGLMTRSSGIGMAFSVSSLIFLVYYIALNGGEQLADKGYMSPFLAMWVSNFVFLIIAILLIIGSINEKRLFNFKAIIWKVTHRKDKKPVPDEIVH